MKWSILTVLAFLGLVGLKAQVTSDYDYEIKTDSSDYKIGASIALWQMWSFPEGAEVLNPDVPDSFGKLMRVGVGKAIFETEDGFTKAKRVSQFTILDTGNLKIPFHRWYFKDSQYIESSPFELNIHLVEADTALPIKPIVPVKQVPHTLGEIFTWVAIGLGALAILLTLLWFLLVYLPKQREKQPKVVVPPDPPHVVALRSLEKLKEEKLWQSGDTKLFHSKLSDIARLYIENHFSFNATDLTTDQVLERLAIMKVSHDVLIKLNSSLQLGDLAKFAKASPMPDENEQCQDTVEEFVKKTQNFFKTQTTEEVSD